MGCFLGCFGISSKRKRRKHSRRILPGNSIPRRICNYEELPNLESPEQEIGKEMRSRKVRKRVQFNLEVQTYEPIPRQETESPDSEDEENEHLFHSEVESTEEKAFFPANHRYGNSCCDDDSDIGIDEEEFETADDDSDNDSKGGIISHSVLKPIENMTQWKAAKSGRENPAMLEKQSKENLPSKKEEDGKLETKNDDGLVTASLSTWLVQFSDD